MKLIGAVLISFLSIFAAAGPSRKLPVPIDSRNLSDIYAAAQKETGVLQVVYGGDEHNQADALAHAFTTQFPNVKVNFTVDLSKYLDGRINNAILQDELYADVAIVQTLQDFDAWRRRGLLLNYKPPAFDHLWSSLSDVDGAYIPVFGTHFGPFVFNTSVVSNKDIPTSYAEILDPKWKGKIVLTYPNDDDAVLYLFTLIIQQYGWQWLEKLRQQDIQWVRGTATPSEVMLLNSSRTISFTTFPLRSGWGYVPPVSDRYMSWAQSSAIFQATRMPETAKLLQAFLISAAGQDVFLQQGLASVRKDIGGSDGTIWDQTNTEYAQFHEFMNQRDVVEAWRLEFEDRLGTPQGISPLVDGIFVV